MALKKESWTAIEFACFLLSSLFGGIFPFHLADFLWGEPLSKSNIIITTLPFVVIGIIALFTRFKADRSYKYSLQYSNYTSGHLKNHLMDIFAIIFVGIGTGSLCICIYVI